MSDIVQIISNVGFPIAMCLLLFYNMREQNAQHKEEMQKMSEAVNNNTTVLQEIKTFLERSE